MRRFPIYAPKIITKHVRIFVNGAIWVKDLGVIHFKQGRFILPKCSVPTVKRAITEMNHLIIEENQQFRTC
ncbi:DUF1107 family protein [Parashewanella spongiae]|uniref:DUF1107 family protein n=1 Tax=Parashewanella spongiae TaxID=342950 RepID=A0A3A6TFQ4_9GAMM|nr:DUF1107 family protein [Parashewanella spongiae]MCL1079678.1 DUF1107 domain-containing protein [Parashewanella spongiae]RJY07057.1 DUF1107 family protein [Parashewanella spongiae]